MQETNLGRRCEVTILPAQGPHLEMMPSLVFFSGLKQQGKPFPFLNLCPELSMPFQHSLEKFRAINVPEPSLAFVRRNTGLHLPHAATIPCTKYWGRRTKAIEFYQRWAGWQKIILSEAAPQHPEPHPDSTAGLFELCCLHFMAEADGLSG